MGSAVSVARAGDTFELWIVAGMACKTRKMSLYVKAKVARLVACFNVAARMAATLVRKGAERKRKVILLRQISISSACRGLWVLHKSMREANFRPINQTIAHCLDECEDVMVGGIAKISLHDYLEMK